MRMPEEKQYRRRRMNRKALEENLGRRIKVRLFDGAEYEGYLRKSEMNDIGTTRTCICRRTITS